jgi:hypothetical protein
MLSSSSPAARARSIQRCSDARRAFKSSGGHRRELARDERALTAASLGEPLVVKLAVRLQHGVRIDREAADDLVDGRELIAGEQDSQLKRLLHLLHELEIGRDAGTAVQVELDHGFPIYLVS